MSKVYRGIISKRGGMHVYGEVGNVAYLLDPRLDLRRHSQGGFAWGYLGSRSTQLALALLADALGDDEKARRFYRMFRRAVIELLPPNLGWILAAEQVHEAIAALESDVETRAA